MTKLDNHPHTPRQYARLYLTGFAMGVADLIPGVSGGTMAFILGIYEDLINAIKSFNIDALRLLIGAKFKALLEHIPWQFVIALMFGIGSAVLLLANVMEWLLVNQPQYLFAFFFGLIIASIIAVGVHIRWSRLTWAMLIIGTVVAFIIVNLIPVNMPHDPLTLFLSGAVAIMAMILPGISGSFILLILGQYDYVLSAVSDLNLLVVLPVAAGAAVGLLFFARVLSWLLNRYEQATIAVLVGFMIGSLWEIWPWKIVTETYIDRHGEVAPLVEANVLPNFASGEFFGAVVLAVFGFFLVSYLDHLQSQSNPVMRALGLNGRQPPLATEQPDVRA
ncbi:MAG: DUF368 domain-containing protein [Chloroflexaceae bacterium]|nr:DUF368 domain-containing protein [Chloroflexaceae bacterium]